MRCAICDGEFAPDTVRAQEEIIVRNEPIIIEAEYYVCSKCGERYIMPNLGRDPLKAAYEKYREKHEMLRPDQIKTWRKKYHFTQEQISKLFGIASATLSRYENGKLQDEAHEKMLRLAMDPACLQRLVTDSIGVFDDKQKKRVLEAIKTEAKEEFSLERWITVNLSSYDVDEYSGFVKWNKEKITNAVTYFCKHGVFKTKLNKLLFYADFKHFKEYTISITGLRYAHVPFGPAPDNFDLLYPMLVRQGDIRIEEIIYLSGSSGDNMVSEREPNLNVFNDSEIRILSTVQEYFNQYNATEISTFSHEEKGYQETLQGKLISYKYASQLKI